MIFFLFIKVKTQTLNFVELFSFYLFSPLKFHLKLPSENIFVPDDFQQNSPQLFTVLNDLMLC